MNRFSLFVFISFVFHLLVALIFFVLGPHFFQSSSPLAGGGGGGGGNVAVEIIGQKEGETKIASRPPSHDAIPIQNGEKLVPRSVPIKGSPPSGPIGPGTGSS